MPGRPHSVWFHTFDSNHLVIGWGDAVKHLQPLQSSLTSLGFVRKHACQEKVTVTQGTKSDAHLHEHVKPQLTQQSDPYRLSHQTDQLRDKELITVKSGRR